LGSLAEADMHHDVWRRPYIVKCNAEEVGHVRVKGNAAPTTMQNQLQIM